MFSILYHSEILFPNTFSTPLIRVRYREASKRKAQIDIGIGDVCMRCFPFSGLGLIA